MLTLYTGTPGAGKTALAVAELLEVQKKAARPVFVMGIPGLQVPHEQAPPVEQWTRQVPVPEDPSLMEAEFTFPDGALIIIDEAQKVFRPRPTGSKVPDHVSAFEKHRHKGLDFWLITQHPNLLDAAVRKLVGRYVHLRGHWAGRELLEWPEAVDPNSRSERANAVRQRYTLPRKVFGLYKSASLHVKAKRRVPKLLWVLLAIVIATGYAGWRSFDKVATAMRGEHPGAAIEGAVARGADPASVPVSPVAPGQAVAPGVALAMSDFIPRLAGRPESAPLYDGIRKVVAMPAVAGCVALRERCTCYTEQGSDVGFSDAECRAWLASPPFNPFRQTLPDTTRERDSRAGAVTGERSSTGRTAYAPPSSTGYQ